jgi:ATP-dependent DNA ligase
MCDAKLIEGMVGKDPRAPYEFRRSPGMIKFRPAPPEDLPIVGFEDTTKPHRPFRSLILRRKDANGTVKEVQASSGLTEEDMRTLDEMFKGKPQRVVGTKHYFTEPIGVAEIKFSSAPDIPFRFPVVADFAPTLEELRIHRVRSDKVS